MMRPTVVHNFLNPEDPPEVVNIRVDNDPPQVQDLILLWPVKKMLTSRDINYSQMVLPRDQVEDFILPKLLPEEQSTMNRGEQLPITVRDMNTESEHRLCLWENGSSYVLTTGWTSSFVRRRQLLIGEEVGFCWDERLRMLRFSVLSRPPPPPPVPQPVLEHAVPQPIPAPVFPQPVPEPAIPQPVPEPAVPQHVPAPAIPQPLPAPALPALVPGQEQDQEEEEEEEA